MTAIYYDSDDDRIFIEGALQTYAPRTLTADCSADMVWVRVKVRMGNEFGPVPYTAIAGRDGVGFPDAASAVAYLLAEFAKRPTSEERVVPVAIEAIGQAVIPLQDPPRFLSTVRLEVNGLVYRIPEIAASAVAVRWQNPDFSLEPSDRVTVVYS